MQRTRKQNLSKQPTTISSTVGIALLVSSLMMFQVMMFIIQVMFDDVYRYYNCRRLKLVCFRLRFTAMMMQ